MILQFRRQEVREIVGGVSFVNWDYRDPGFWRLQEIAGSPWLYIDASPQSLPVSAQMFPGMCVVRVCVYLHISSFYKDTSHTGLGTHPLQHHLILTNYIHSDPIPDEVTG